MTVTVLRGSEAALISFTRSSCAAPSGLPAPPLYFAPLPGPRRSFGAFRALLGQIRRLVPETAVEAVLRGHAPAATLLLPSRLPDLNALRARPTSHMTHNFLLQHPAFEAYAALLADLAALRPGAPLLVPSQALLGWEDSAVLKAVYRRFADRAPNLVFGFDPGFRHSMSAGGIVWTMTTYRSLSFALDIQALQEGEPVDLPPAAEPGATWDEALGAALSGIAEDPDDPHDPDIPSAEAVRSAFASFSFTSVLRLGLELLAAGTPLAPEDAADVHGLIALAAHNRQFLATDPELADFLERHLAAALAHESRPAHRCALLYRRAVLHGRRRKDFPAALVWADRALAASQEDILPPLEAAYQETWARNIRAYVLMRLGRAAEAEAETVAGFARIDAVLATMSEPAEPAAADLWGLWDLDVRATHSLLAFNTRTLLELLRRDTGELAVWLARSRDAVREVPAVVRFEAFHWVELYTKMMRPDLALPMALRGLEDARREVDALREYEHALNAADFCERLGETVLARALYERIQAFRRRCGLPRLPALDVSWAAVCQREGLYEEARSRLEAVMNDAAQVSADARAELLARLARLEADAGREDEADRALADAEELAIESGERDTLLRVAVAAGRCRQALGDGAAALEAYEQALEIARAGGEGAPPPPPAELLAALLGLAECGADDTDNAALLPRALSTAAAALDDTDAWWDLSRLLALLRDRWPATTAPEDSAAGLRVLTAARQRRDCARLIPASCAVLGVPLSSLPPAADERSGTA
jgi:tetratricopeptide (TPR) repeat protein